MHKILRKFSFVFALSGLFGTYCLTASVLPQTVDLPKLLTGSEKASAISYSGYRDGQRPGGPAPSDEQIAEDLRLLSQRFNLIRLYGAGDHAEAVLRVIKDRKIPLKVMQGAWLAAEVNNPNCPWHPPVISPEGLAANRKANEGEVGRAIALAKAYPDIISAVAVGNEILVDWTDHQVPVDSLITYVKRVKDAVAQPVTVADNYVPWSQGQDKLVELLDFVTIHSYPIWENKSPDQAMPFTLENFQSVASRYPGKAIAIGEAGWTTGTNGVQISPSVATEAQQLVYFNAFRDWAFKNHIVGFFFTAFDENWKGSADAAEPEKHWGLFHADRSPKEAAKALYAL